ncbi:MAG: hypothetical protein WA417_09905 [Stellaceae bacterium]
MPKLISVGVMRGNSGFLRRQEPISPAIEWLHDGSLPSQGSRKEEHRSSRKAM